MMVEPEVLYPCWDTDDGGGLRHLESIIASRGYLSCEDNWCDTAGSLGDDGWVNRRIGYRSESEQHRRGWVLSEGIYDDRDRAIRVKLGWRQSELDAYLDGRRTVT